MSSVFNRCAALEPSTASSESWIGRFLPSNTEVTLKRLRGYLGQSVTVTYVVRIPTPSPSIATDDGDWITAALQLRSLHTLPMDWDPDGALPPSREAIDHAERFFGLLHDAEVPPIRISPSVVEGVCFSFYQAGKYAAVEFLNEGTVNFVLMDYKSPPIVQCQSNDDSWLRSAIKQITEFLV